MAKQLFNPNFTDDPPRDYAPPPSDDDFEFLAGPPDFPVQLRRVGLLRGRRVTKAKRNALVILSVVAGAVVGLLLYSQLAHGTQATADMKVCESGYEVFPEANTTVIYMLSDECSKIRATDLEEQKKYLAEHPILPPAVKPLEKIDDSLLEDQQ